MSGMWEMVSRYVGLVASTNGHSRGRNSDGQNQLLFFFFAVRGCPIFTPRCKLAFCFLSPERPGFAVVFVAFQRREIAPPRPAPHPSLCHCEKVDLPYHFRRPALEATRKKEKARTRKQQLAARPRTKRQKQSLRQGLKGTVPPPTRQEGHACSRMCSRLMPYPRCVRCVVGVFRVLRPWSPVPASSYSFNTRPFLSSLTKGRWEGARQKKNCAARKNRKRPSCRWLNAILTRNSA